MMMGKSVKSSAPVSGLESLDEILSDEKPKTGYTYANGLPYNIHGDPNPPMPNMSRYSLDHYSRLTEHGYDYSQSSHSSAARSEVALSQSRFHSSSPEPVYTGFAEYLAKLYRRTIQKTITTTTTTSRNNQDDYNDQHLSSAIDENFQLNTISGRVTPESRSGNDVSERWNRSYISAGKSNRELRSSQFQLSSALRREERELCNHHNKETEEEFCQSDGNAFPVASEAYAEDSTGNTRGSFYSSTSARRREDRTMFEYITRRFIDIVTTTTTTISKTITEVSQDDKGRRRWWWIPLLFLLFLFPLLTGLWWYAPAALRKDLIATPSVIYNFYHDLAEKTYFPWTKESHNASIMISNQSSEAIQNVTHIHVQPPNLPPMKDCCDDVRLLQEQVRLILQKLDGFDKDDSENSKWRKDRERSEQELRTITQDLRTMLVRVEEEITLRRELVPNIVRERESFTLEDVSRVVKESIRRYDEDRISEPDHALESAGATVVSTRCTEDYKWGYARYSLFGIPLWSWTTTPRLAIQPDIRPGQCWAFKGNQGYLVIKLTGQVRPTSFTLEHLPKALSPTGKIDSAPKQFEVYGLTSEQGPGYVLGQYTYEDNGDSLQNFQIQTKLEPGTTFPFVELRITSNHGNPEYTCLYRFRVHGLLVKREEL
ncbi:hypothetical protein RvY_13695 [Ramazzottius varieornatus]|uniref:SUN domain-containing protein n=1 Tax=Ramazzottius varieornatus TaxID=947166 RepID=A0A1D1VSU6_RAMVA|nr:hypothetical protein RvY_13695 [Ramazzottius varieornatus]